MTAAVVISEAYRSTCAPEAAARLDRTCRYSNAARPADHPEPPRRQTADSPRGVVTARARVISRSSRHVQPGRRHRVLSSDSVVSLVRSAYAVQSVSLIAVRLHNRKKSNVVSGFVRNLVLNTLIFIDASATRRRVWYTMYARVSFFVIKIRPETSDLRLGLFECVS